VSFGNSRPTTSPARYHSMSFRVAKQWRKSWSSRGLSAEPALGRAHAARSVQPPPAPSTQDGRPRPLFQKGSEDEMHAAAPGCRRRAPEWLPRQEGKADDPVFPSSNGRRMSADALQRLVARHVATARQTCPSLIPKTVTPYTLRHGAAMALLRRGVDLSVIALWLGHESTETTQIYLHADMQLRRKGWRTPRRRANRLTASSQRTRCSRS
jgi:hypothetical protein